MWLMVDTEECLVEYENEDRAKVEKEIQYYIDHGSEKGRYILVFYEK